MRPELLSGELFCELTIFLLYIFTRRDSVSSLIWIDFELSLISDAGIGRSVDNRSY